MADPPRADPSEAPRQFKPGDRLAHYEILHEIGRGGMGAVYRARHVHLETDVAIKVLRTEDAHDPEHRIRFVREARAAARVQHDHVIQVLHVSDTDPLHIVMELVEGETLQQLLSREKKLSLSRSLELLVPVMAAVQAAHDRGVIHRDLKPANVVLARQRDQSVKPKVLDFGIAKITRVGTSDTPDAQSPHPEMELTIEGQHLGTPNYMAPEQWFRAREALPQSDQYALACILYRCVTGELPFKASNVPMMIAAKSQGKIVPPTSLANDLPGAIDSVIERALRPDPSMRFESVGEMAVELLSLLDASARKRWEVEFGVLEHESLAELTEGDVVLVPDPGAESYIDAQAVPASFPSTELALPAPSTTAPANVMDVSLAAREVPVRPTTPGVHRERWLLVALVAMTCLTFALGGYIFGHRSTSPDPVAVRPATVIVSTATPPRVPPSPTTGPVVAPVDSMAVVQRLVNTEPVTPAVPVENPPRRPVPRVTPTRPRGAPLPIILPQRNR
jgi:serine/threonine-protein kinase